MRPRTRALIAVAAVRLQALPGRVIHAQQLAHRKAAALGPVAAPVEFVERLDQRVDDRKQRPERGSDACHDPKCWKRHRAEPDGLVPGACPSPDDVREAHRLRPEKVVRLSGWAQVADTTRGDLTEVVHRDGRCRMPEGSGRTARRSSCVTPTTRACTSRCSWVTPPSKPSPT